MAACTNSEKLTNPKLIRMIGNMKYKGMSVGSYMKCTHTVKGIRFNDSMFSNVCWTINFEFVAINSDITSLTRAVERVTIWLETLHDVVVISPDDSKDVTNLIMGMSDNNVMFVPQRASDDIIVRLIHCKLQTLLDGYCSVGKIQIESTDNAIISCFAPNTDMQSEIPLDGYMDGFKRLHDTNWWERNDGFCVEFALPEDIDADLHEVYADVVDPLSCIPLRDEEDENTTEDSVVNVIKFEKNED